MFSLRSCLLCLPDCVATKTEPFYSLEVLFTGPAVGSNIFWMWGLGREGSGTSWTESVYCITRHLGIQPFKIFAIDCLLRSGLGVDGHAEAILYVYLSNCQCQQPIVTRRGAIERGKKLLKSPSLCCHGDLHHDWCLKIFQKSYTITIWLTVITLTIIMTYTIAKQQP